jgi:hypothetical protein
MSHSSQRFNFRYRSAEWLFNHTRNATFEQVNSFLHDVVYRHDANAGVGLLDVKHVV